MPVAIEAAANLQLRRGAHFEDSRGLPMPPTVDNCQDLPGLGQTKDPPVP